MGLLPRDGGGSEFQARPPAVHQAGTAEKPQIVCELCGTRYNVATLVLAGVCEHVRAALAETPAEGEG